MNFIKFFSPQQKNPNLWVKIVVAVNVFYYLASLLVSVILPHGGIMGFFSPSNYALVVMGASGQEIVFKFHMFYSLMNANFLHANLMHIAFNMLAFFQLFRPVCWSFGTDRALVIYIVSGVFAFLCSAVIGIQFTVGASGAVFGLMGALLYFGKSRGDAFGRNIFMQIGIWALLILVMGFVSEGVNNVAHLTGLISGVALAWFLGFKTRETKKVVIAANVCIIIAVLCLLYPVLVLFRL